MQKKLKIYGIFAGVLFAQGVMTIIWIVNLKKIGGIVWVFGVFFGLFSICMDYVIYRFFETVQGRVRLEEEITQLYKIREKELNYGTIADEHVQDVEQLGVELEEKIDSSLELLIAYGEGKDNREEAEKILRGMEEIVKERKFIHYCDNSMINALLDAKVQVGKEQGFTLNVQCKIPQTTHLDEYELCGLFENMVNAAFEICGKYFKDVSQIQVKADEKLGKLIIRVDWEINGDEEFCSFNKKQLEKKLWCAKLTLVEKICQKRMGKIGIRKEENKMAVIAIV